MSDSVKSNDTGKIWKSLNEYNDDTSLVKIKNDEFLEGVTDDFKPEDMPGISRRKFLALLSASAAVTATACSDYQNKGEIVPYTNRPEEILPGKANYYASTCNGCSQSCGILIKTREGRPIKVDGNPDHPVNKGKICATGQTSILNLYDPERLQYPLMDNAKTKWSIADKNILAALNAAKEAGKKIALITGSLHSPTAKKLLDDFKSEFPSTKLYSYDLFNNANRLNAWQKSYGTKSLPSIKWDKAKIVLALEADFLGREGDTIESIRLFTGQRDVIKSEDFNRLYVAEGGMSLTGMNSDYRFKIRPDAQYDFVMSLLDEIIRQDKEVYSLPGDVMAKINEHSLSQFVEKYNLNHEKVRLLVDDLIVNRGVSIVYGGDTLSEAAHVAINLLNEVLGNTGIYNYESMTQSLMQYSKSDDWNDLVKSMNDGDVAVVINYDSNPVYHLPAKLNFKDALQNVKTKISLVESENETSEVCNYVLPVNHPFESWGDAAARNNVYSLQQPVIAPIFNTRQKEAILLTWLTGNHTGYSQDIYHKYLMSNFRTDIYDKQNVDVDFNTYWFAALHDGVVKLKDTVSSHTMMNLDGIQLLPSTEASEGFIIHLQKSYFLGDGCFANNGWLQELPHPVTKVTWDNYAAVSPKTAKELGVDNDDLLNVSVDGNEVMLPVYIQPGMAEKLLTVEMGYGRTKIGDVGKDVGVNVNTLLNDADLSKWVLSNVNVTKISGTHKLVSTQEHHSLDDLSVKDLHLKRKIIREGTVRQYQSNPHFLHEGDHDVFSITKSHEYKDVKWAMSIDLNKCISCSVCVASCNVENNIPVVGKDQVEKGREMHWMRLDRYYTGTPEEPVASNQPMLCQHCDNAPCENVCPVNATNHSPDGLNQMAYNRCVGTRYCANNCPYKVRRFNFFNFRDHFEGAYYENELTSLANNPEVTVRSRGVMEKCTFCVQRIMDARSEAIKEGRSLKGSDVTTACQQACPSQAIVFGDANDPESEIAKYREHDLGYHVLEELNVMPNVTYIAKLRNTHSEES